MAELSVSKSAVSSPSNAESNLNSSRHKKKLIDHFFPLYDQIMQRVHLPNWFSTLCDIFLAFQVLTSGFWIFSQPFQRTTGVWKKIYYWINMIVSFQDPLNTSETRLINAGICIGVSIFAIMWLIFMVYYYYNNFVIPTVFLYLSVVFLDLIAPAFIMPSAYTAGYGIASLLVAHNHDFIVEIVLGSISYIVALFFFILGTLLKSRSVIFTNLTYQCYDSTFVIVWFSMTSFECILSAIFRAFDGKFYLFIPIIHLGCALWMCYRTMFIPFYALWRNPICFQFGMVTTALDINLVVLYLAPKLTYNYTIVVFLAITVLAHPVGQFVFKLIVSKKKKQLTNNEEISDMTEYFDSLGIVKSASHCMSYIVVGMAEMCDYFIDGALTDYIILRGEGEGILSLMLQVMTYLPCESQKLNMLYKKLIKKRNLSFINRFLIFQISMVRTRRLVTNTKDTLEIFTRLKSLNEQIKFRINSFWDLSSAKSSFLSELVNSTQKLQNQFEYTLKHNPNNTRIINEYVNFLVECRCDFDEAILQALKSDMICDGKDFNVDVSFRSFVSKFPLYLKKKIFDFRGRKMVSDSSMKKDDKNIMDNSMNNVKSSTTSNSSGIEFMPTSVDNESEEQVGGRIIKQSKVRILLNRNIKDSTPTQSRWVIISSLLTFSIGVVILIAFYFTQSNSLNFRIV